MTMGEPMPAMDFVSGIIGGRYTGRDVHVSSRYDRITVTYLTGESGRSETFSDSDIVEATLALYGIEKHEEGDS